MTANVPKLVGDLVIEIISVEAPWVSLRLKMLGKNSRDTLFSIGPIWAEGNSTVVLQDLTLELPVVWTPGVQRGGKG
jgi:hypothetical protein